MSRINDNHFLNPPEPVIDNPEELAEENAARDLDLEEEEIERNIS